jgi:hypothetical protein
LASQAGQRQFIGLWAIDQVEDLLFGRATARMPRTTDI